MDQSTKTGPIPPESVPDTERRRIGEVVHDDRGNASVRWLDAPSDYQRPVLEVAPDSAAARKPEESFDPYARGATPGPGRITAAVYLRRRRRRLLNSVCQWTNEKKFRVNKLLSRLIDRCDQLDLCVLNDDPQQDFRVTSYLTTLVMNYLFTGKFKRTK